MIGWALFQLPNGGGARGKKVTREALPAELIPDDETKAPLAKPTNR